MDLHRLIPPAHRERWTTPWRLMELLVLLGIGALILQNRVALGRAFLFEYADEDQTLLWHAGMDLLHGRIPEPCFYGQSFNTCLEGYLAAPLLWAHVPPWYALPAITIFLGLLPFLALALYAWRCRRPVLAGFSLLIPAVLPVRYAMLTGMPRGFVTGIAVAIFPCLLILDPPDTPGPTTKPGVRRRDRWRFFAIGLLAVTALTVNPNCSLLLAPAFAFALATRLRQVSFWLYSGLGALIGALYPLGVLVFYFILHADYRFYPRQGRFAWTLEDFRQFFDYPSLPFADLLPVGLDASATPWFFVIGFAALLLFLILTRRFAVVLALLVGATLTVFSFGFARTHEGQRSVFFAYSRMYLALPVLPPLLLLWSGRRPNSHLHSNPPPQPSPPEAAAGDSRASPATAATDVNRVPSTLSPHMSLVSPSLPRMRPWQARLLLLIFGVVAVFATRHNLRQISATSTYEVQNKQWVQLVSIRDSCQLAGVVQDAARTFDAHVVLLVDADKPLIYLLPILTDCQTLHPFADRRTWRFGEESVARHPRVLVLSRDLFEKAERAGYGHPAIIHEVPFVGVFDTDGKSLLRICQEFDIPIRSFARPAKSDLRP